MSAARTVVHVMRHGEVDNPDGILYGRLPGFQLSGRGVEQAKMVAEFLADRDITYVAASPLQRAQETASPIASQFRVTIATDEGLIEAANRFEGMRVSVGDGALRSPLHWPKLWNPVRPSWGEPYLRIARRMLGAVYRARASASGSEAVCVSHQLPIWTLRRFLEAKPLWHDPRRRQCALASVTSFVFDDDELVRIAYVEPVGSTDPRVTGA
jgi:broad specificity phosphatase PhoE